MWDWIDVRGPERAVYLFNTRLVGMNADNVKKLLFTVFLLVFVLLLGWVLRAAIQVIFRNDRNKRTAFWARQGVRLTVNMGFRAVYRSARFQYCGYHPMYFADISRKHVFQRSFNRILSLYARQQFCLTIKAFDSPV